MLGVTAPPSLPHFRVVFVTSVILHPFWDFLYRSSAQFSVGLHAETRSLDVSFIDWPYLVVEVLGSFDSQVYHFNVSHGSAT